MSWTNGDKIAHEVAAAAGEAPVEKAAAEQPHAEGVKLDDEAKITQVEATVARLGAGIRSVLLASEYSQIAAGSNFAEVLYSAAMFAGAMWIAHQNSAPHKMPITEEQFPELMSRLIKRATKSLNAAAEAQKTGTTVKDAFIQMMQAAGYKVEVFETEIPSGAFKRPATPATQAEPTVSEPENAEKTNYPRHTD